MTNNNGEGHQQEDTGEILPAWTYRELKPDQLKAVMWACEVERPEETQPPAVMRALGSLPLPRMATA